MTPTKRRKTTMTTTRKTTSADSMGKKEKTILIMAATKAHKVQLAAGLADDDFDTWRHEECRAAVGKPGLTACHHDDFRPLLAHFQTLAGDDAEALANLLKSGSPTDHAAPGDTHEERRHLAHQIATAITDHNALANAHITDLSPAQATRQAAIHAHGQPIGVGYLTYIVRTKTHRPALTLGSDWEAGLADRCTVSQLTQIRSTIVNRIAAIEHPGTTKSRNRSQRKAS